MKVVGIVLILLGVLALVYQGINYTKRREVVELGPVQMTAEQKETIPVPPIVGGILVVAGAGLLLMGRRRS
jgi:hypothetical protein